MKTIEGSTLTIRQSTLPEIIQDLQTKMETGICHFTFKKKDGSLREAFGTWCPEKYGQPRVAEKKQTEEIENAQTVVFFDLQAMGWRSFITANLITVF